MVEVLHFMGGEDSPRRVLCPWRAHPLASTLPAVARATAACSVRCEWMIGRGVGLLRGSSSGWCVRCSSGCDNLENGGQADSRRQWLGPLTTDGQPCGEHLTDQLLHEPLSKPSPRPIIHSAPHGAGGRRSSNGRQGAGQQVRPPGTEHPRRDDLAAHEVQHLNHLVPRSSSRVELLLQLPQRVPAAPFSTGLAWSSVDSLRRQGTQGRR